jgi:23S rRNA (uracil1939-C5)-methyltransferase
MGQTEHPAAVPADLDRAEPQCPHFGPCGGCQLQDVAYTAQLRHKGAQLRALLAKHDFSFGSGAEEAAATRLPEIQGHPSPPFAYRNRIRLTLGEVDGQLRAGYIRSSIDPRTGCPTSGVPGERVCSLGSASGFSDVGSPDSEDSEDVDPSLSSLARSFLPITQCPIAAPILWRATEAFLALANRQSGLWLSDTQHALDQLELFTTADESRLQLSVYLRARTGSAAKAAPAKLAAAFAALCESLRTRIPELTGAGSFLLPPKSTQRSRRAEQPRPGPTWGAPGLNYTVPTPGESITTQDKVVILTLSETKGKNPRISSLPLPAPQLTTNNQQLATAFWVPRGAFFQINRFLIPELVSLVTAGYAGALAWDLYAGVGLFSRALAARFLQVTAVEIGEPAAGALAATVLVNLRAVKATTLDFLRAAVVERDRPDLIVLDPPRSGAGPEVCELLARIAAPILIYISCSPETLPADLGTLAASGYTIAELHLLDLFPQTTHIETVAILTR